MAFLKRYIVDSGATKSITSSEINLENKRNFYGTVTFGDEQKLIAKYIGSISGLKDVIYVPGCQFDIISADSLGKQTGCKVVFDSGNNSVSLVKEVNSENIDIIIGEKCADGLYRTFDDFSINQLRADNSFILLSQDIQLNRSERQLLKHNNLWKQLHIKLGHASISKIHSMREDRCIQNLFIPQSLPANFYCEACALGKAHKTAKTKQIENEVNNEVEVQSFDKIYSDIGGPLTKSMNSGYRFYVFFIDKKSKYKWIYYLHSKDELKKKFQLFQNKIKLEFGKNIGILKSDRGGEYLDGDFSMYLNSCGVIQETTAPYSQWQNGVAERANRTIKDMARTMLIAAKLPAALWTFAMDMAVYLSNRLANSSLPKNISSYQSLYNRRPDLKHIHPFGCDVYVPIDDTLRTDLEPKSNLRYYLGPVNDTNDIFNTFNPVSKRLSVSRDGYQFDDNMINISFRGEIKLNNIDFILSKPSQTVIHPQNIISNNGVVDIPITVIPSEAAPVVEDPVINNIINERPKRTVIPNMLYRDFVTAAITEEVTMDDIISVDGNKSLTLSEVRQMDDWPQYEIAMQLEMEAINKNNTWEDVYELPEGRKPIGYVWVFNRKIHENPVRYKARLCAQGFSQTHGFDYFETYSPVIRQASIRIILSIAAAECMYVHQMDVNTAFLNGEIDTEVYMRRPNELGGDAPFVKLKKALYGLKQASRIWNNNIDEFMKELEFKQSIVEPCIYIFGELDTKVIVGIYVDDLIIASPSLDQIQFVKNALMIKYSMKDLGELNTIIGIKVIRDRDGISMNQGKYIDAIVDRFNMNDAYAAYVPMLSNIKFTSYMDPLYDPIDLTTEDIPYRQAVGALLYATQCTRPDINFSVSKVSQYMNCYSIPHWQAVEQIIRFLKTTKDCCIRYKRHNDPEMRNILEGYCDADWASDIESRKSQSGYVFYLNGGPISWASNKQTTVALSSVESEYIALSAATQELVYLRQLLEDMGYPQSKPTTLYEDNQGAIHLADNHGTFSKRTKHIDVRHHYMRDVMKRGWLVIKHIPTERQLADTFTKALVLSKFRVNSAHLVTPMSSAKNL